MKVKTISLATFLIIALSALIAGFACAFGGRANYERELSALLSELTEHKGACDERALSLSCDYDTALKIAEASGGTLDMYPQESAGRLSFANRTAIEVVQSGCVNEYLYAISPEYFLYPETVEGTFNDNYAVDNDRYLFSHIGLGDNGEVRSLTKGSTEKHTSRVVIVDSGIDFDHEEYLADDGTVRLSELSYSVSKGRTVAESGGDWSIIDEENGSNHGTQVTSAIFARGNNGKGVVGLAEDVELILVKITLSAQGSFTVTDFNRALAYVATLKNVDVVNLSLGAYNIPNDFSSNLRTIKRNGAVIVGAAGNSKVSDVHYPSADSSVVAVGAFANLQNVSNGVYPSASYSSYGDVNVDICAPGRFTTALPADAAGAGKYNVANGTSLAAPVITAAVALYRSLYPEATPDEVIAALYESADDQGDCGKDYIFGYGGVNFYKFLMHEQASVTFDFGGGQTQTASFAKGSALQKYPFPETLPQGLSFGGWYLDSNYTQPVNYYREVFSDGATVYAKWEKEESAGAFDYTLNTQGKVVIKGYYGNSQMLYVPSTIKVGGSEITVAGIAARAFQNTAIKKLILPKSVTAVEEYAFAGGKFSYLYFPSSLKSVAKYAVVNSIGSLYIYGSTSGFTSGWNTDSKMTEYTQAGEFSVENGMELVGGKEKTVLFYNGNERVKTLEVSDGKIVAVSDGAFKDNKALTDLNMPDVVTIKASAFEGNVALQRVNMPNVRTIGENAFAGCVALTCLEIPATATAIQARAFRGCTSLISVKFEGGELATLSDGVFENCSKLQSIDLTSLTKLTTVGGNVFTGCTELFLAALPDSVTSIGGNVFSQCPNIVALQTPLIGNGETSKTHLGYFFGSSFVTNQSVPSSLKYVYVTRNDIASDALNGLGGFTVLANGRSNANSANVTVHSNGNFAMIRIYAGDVLVGLLGGEEGAELSKDTLSASYYVPAGVTSNGFVGGTPTSFKTGNYQLNTSKNSIHVEFYDGEELLSAGDYAFGDTVQAPIPERESTESVAYIFSGWDKPVTAATKDVKYYAQFTTAARTYTIRFVDSDGTILAEQELEYGQTPQPPQVPDRYTDDAQYYQKFVGWNKQIASVSGNAEYVAQYENALRKYTVTFRYDSADGEIFHIAELEYGSQIVPPSTDRADKVYLYTFSGWNRPFESVTGNAEYYALYSREYILYTVRFLNWNGDIISLASYRYGEIPAIPDAIPERESDNENSYTFAGWGNIVAVTENVDYVAQFTVSSNFVTIRFMNYNNSVLIEEQRVARGSTITPPQAPERPSTNPDSYVWVFSGWTPTITEAVADATYTAYYTRVNVYRVRFLDWDGTVLYDELLPQGSEVIAPEAPSRDSDERYEYTFKSWDKEITTVTGNADYTAIYEQQEILYTIRFLDKDGNVISEERYAYGAQVIAPAAPVVEGYTFDGWGEITAVTGDKDYRATYTKNPEQPDPPGGGEDKDKDDPVPPITPPEQPSGGCGGCGTISAEEGGIIWGGSALLIFATAVALAIIRKRQRK